MTLIDLVCSMGVSVMWTPPALLRSGGKSQIPLVDQNSKQNQAAAKIWPVPYVVYISLMWRQALGIIHALDDKNVPCLSRQASRSLIKFESLVLNTLFCSVHLFLFCSPYFPSTLRKRGRNRQTKPLPVCSMKSH